MVKLTKKRQTNGNNRNGNQETREGGSHSTESNHINYLYCHIYPDENGEELELKEEMEANFSLPFIYSRVSIVRPPINQIPALSKLVSYPETYGITIKVIPKILKLTEPLDYMNKFSPTWFG